jgi:hypothetical protein
LGRPRQRKLLRLLLLHHAAAVKHLRQQTRTYNNARERTDVDDWVIYFDKLAVSRVA